MGLYHSVCVFLLSAGVSSTLLSCNPTREQGDDVCKEVSRLYADITTHRECLLVHLFVTPISAHSVAIRMAFYSTIQFHAHSNDCATMMGFQPIHVIPLSFHTPYDILSFCATLPALSDSCQLQRNNAPNPLSHSVLSNHNFFPFFSFHGKT